MGIHALGIHPWDLSPEISMSKIKEQFDLLKTKPMLAIGECGLDRRRKNIKSIELQEEVFSWHLDLAQALKKPLIVHCVHAESDLLSILKKSRFQGMLLLHDFVGNSKSLEQFKNYNVYFSFGARLFSQNKNVEEFLKLVPLNQLFLETDDQSQYSIEEIYQKASELLGISEDDLSGYFERNLKTFFNYSHDISASDIINNFATTSRS